MESGLISFLILLDFSKAFSSVDHSILLSKLREQFGFTECAIKLLQSYLSHRVQQVKLKDDVSKFCEVTSGVPEGSILGPILFSLFINDLGNCVVGAHSHLFADDFQIYDCALVQDISPCITKLNGILQHVSTWALSNKISINCSKSQAVVITNKKIDCLLIDKLRLGNDIIEFVNKVRNLGLIMNNKLTWSDHTNNVTSKVYSILSKLWMSEKFTPRNIKIKLIKSLIVPIFTYCAPIYAGCANSDWQKLNVAFNSCARYAFNVRRGDPISSLAKSLLGCSLRNYFHYSSCVFLYKLIRFKSPSYLYSKIEFSLTPRNLNNINFPPRSKTLARSSSFFVHGVKLWRSLSADLRNLESIGAFKCRSLTHFSSL